MAGKFFMRINIITACISKKTSRNRNIYECFISVQYIISPASQWPNLIRILIWARHLSHWERILICTFVFVNGLNPVIFYEWITLKNLARDRADLDRFRTIFRLAIYFFLNIFKLVFFLLTQPTKIYNFNIFRLFNAGRNYIQYAWNVSQR